MEKNYNRNEEKSFKGLTQQREAEDRMNRYYVQAVGDEDITRREANVKHFDMGANRYQAVVYAEPVHYRESGSNEWKEIDNTLEEAASEQGRRVLRNRANRVQVELPCTADDGSMAAITVSGNTFAWKFEKEVHPVDARIRSGEELKRERLAKLAQKQPKYVGRTLSDLQAADLEKELGTEQERRADIAKLRSQSIYEELLPGVSVKYTLSSESVKEDIILSEAEALKNAAIRLSKEYEYKVTDGHELKVLDKSNGKELFVMSAPVVYDAEGAETDAEIALTDCGEYVRMEYQIDPEYMAKAAYT